MKRLACFVLGVGITLAVLWLLATVFGQLARMM